MNIVSSPGFPLVVNKPSSYPGFLAYSQLVPGGNPGNKVKGNTRLNSLYVTLSA